MNISSTPSGFRITSRFGDLEPFRLKPHTGIDVSMPSGTPLQSAADGIVDRVVDYGSENIGQGIIIRLKDGSQAIYGHMSEIDVKVGQHVNAGDVIGLSGNTGYSTGPHLHFGMMKGGEYIDPLENTLDPNKGILWRVVESGIEHGKESVRQGAESMTKEIAAGILDALGGLILDMSYGVALVGSGLCIVFKVAGWDGGYKWAGILVVAYVFIRYLLGGL
jgi:hypothetical protein